MDRYFLGIDTSNYTTSLSVALNGEIIQNIKLPLIVSTGEKGLRQSDAVFAHTKNLPEAFERLENFKFSAVGVSITPRDEEGSYMPCFLSGVAAAQAVAKTSSIPLFPFSHQRNHFAAAAYSAGSIGLLESDFIGFHVSGGTTEIVLYSNGKISNIGGTRDLNAGQAIDRAGVLLGLRFPCGEELEKLAVHGRLPENTRICVDELECNISGVENKVGALKEKGAKREDIALFIIQFIGNTLDALSENARRKYPLPILYAGGVMGNRIVKGILSKREKVYFALPEFSCDNAAGVALLAEREYIKNE